MISFSFFFADPKGVIDKGMLTLLSMLLILVLSEAFDNFSLGKLISINRDVKKKDEQVKDLDKKNSELLKQILTISNTQTQAQTHTNVYGDYIETPSKQRVSDQKTKPKVDKEEVERLLAAVGDSIVIQDIVGRIKAELEAKGLPTDGDSVKILIRHLAGTQLLLIFEQIHRIIFGSQIYLLKKLNETIEKGKSVESVHEHVDHVKSIFTDNLSSWDYDQYLSYLFSHQLIIKGEDEKLYITNLGVEYLTWIIRNGRREDNPL